MYTCHSLLLYFTTDIYSLCRKPITSLEVKHTTQHETLPHLNEQNLHESNEHVSVYRGLHFEAN